MGTLASELKGLNLKQGQVNFSEAIDRIMSGRAILFTGSGFSAGAENAKGESPPNAAGLSKMICRLGGFEEDADLMFTSDYFLAHNDPEPLIDLLKETFAIKNTTEYHDIISNVAWKRIYTTNYDNVVERAAIHSGKVIDGITAEDHPGDYFKKHNVCVHINGDIHTLSETSLQSKFKLSASSYVSPDSFASSPWYYPFKKDIERASAIIFVGYSLYDVDIQKILFESPELKNKTYFVTKPDPGEKLSFTLSKYGTIFPIGTDGFSALLKDRMAREPQDDQGSELWLEAFAEYEVSENEGEITDTEIIEFIMHGNLGDGFIANAAAGIQKKPYIINRTGVDTLLNFLKTEKIVAICSELGNGKTVLCKELMAHLSLLGKKCFYLDDSEGDYIGDIERLERTNSESTLIIEGYERYPDILKHFMALNPKKLRMVLCARTASHERMRPDLLDLSLEPHEVNLDFMDNNEVMQLVGIIDNVGYWGKEAHRSAEGKKAIIKQVCQSQISHTLLNLFIAPQIKDRIGELVKKVSENENHKRTLFAICLLESLDLPLRASLISELSFSNDIYGGAIRNDSYFTQLYQVKYGIVQSKSSLFSMHLLNHHFAPSFVVDTLLEIVKKYDKLQGYGVHEREIFQLLLRFSSLERILPEKNKRNSLIKYYEELKVLIPWMKRNPHYWLQYGMARITFKEYSLADAYFGQAYSLARDREGYDTSYLDNQMARLWLLKSAEESDSRIAFKCFIEAHKLLLSQADDVYKFRQAALYKDFFESFYGNLPQKNKVFFERACEAILKSLGHIYNPSQPFRHDHTTLRSCAEKLEGVLDAIKSAGA